MRSIEARLTKLEKEAGSKKDYVTYSVFTGEDPEVKRAEAVKAFIAERGRKPSPSTLYVRINKLRSADTEKAVF
jgi:hypothetical protein